VSYTPIPAGTPDWDVPVNAAFTDQDGRITSNTASIDTQSTQITNLQADVGTLQTDVADNTADIATNTANIATNTSNIATNTTNIATNASNISTLQIQSVLIRNGSWLPSDQGAVAWSIDPSEATTGTVLTSGTMIFAAVPVRAATSFSNITFGASSAGATLTAGQNLIGLYDSAGNRVATSADQSANWTSTGIKTTAMVGAPIALSAGIYYVAMLSNGTTPVGVFREANQVSANIINWNLTASTYRFAELAGQTSLPASIDLSTRSTSSFSFWFGLS
jgi:hypothetical protein